MSDSLKREIVQRMFRNFLDVMVLKLVEAEPMWGYKIIRHVEEKYEIRLRHGALYPLLNSLEKEGLMRSKRETKGGRVRKVYDVTPEGMKLVDTYIEFLRS